MTLSEWAAGWAEGLLGKIGQRWDHSEAVAARAQQVADRLRLPDGEVLVAAAYLHDIGYAPEFAASGFHPLDGARHLREAGRERLACLVAHHGGAAEEAQLRGLADDLRAFDVEEGMAAKVLDYCDLTVSPSGQVVTVIERLDDVEARYGPDHVVTRGLRLAWTRLEGRVAEVADRLESVTPGAHPR